MIGIFMIQESKRCFFRANAIFLEDDYIMNHKPKGMIVLEEVMGEPSDSPIVNSNTEQENAMTLPSSAPVPCCSGRIVKGSLTHSCS